MRADRLLSLLMVLQTKKQCTAQELAQRLEVSERTIYRDIEALSAAGIPVYAERGPGGGCRLAEGYRTALTGLTKNEITTLLLSYSVVAPLAELNSGSAGGEKAWDAALLKLLAALPSTQQRDIERMRQRLYMDATWWWYGRDTMSHFQVLQEAVWQDLKLMITYRKSSGETSERTIDPLALVIKAGTWYLVAAQNEELRVFRVSRIVGAQILNEPARRPPDFELAAYWAQWCKDFIASTSLSYSTTLRISPLLVLSLPQIFGESINSLIEEAEAPDSEGWITIRMQFGSKEVACSYVMGFGAMVEVLEPASLRDEVVQTANSIVQFYRDANKKGLN